MIGLGQQPATQLSLDYIMQENYGRHFVDSSCNGSWSQCIGGDGILRNGLPFSPLVNCLGTGGFGEEQLDGPSEEKFASLAYLGLIEAGMMDHLSKHTSNQLLLLGLSGRVGLLVITAFINGEGYQRDTQARLAEQFREIRPSLQGACSDQSTAMQERDHTLCS